MYNDVSMQLLTVMVITDHASFPPSAYPLRLTEPPRPFLIISSYSVLSFPYAAILIILPPPQPQSVSSLAFVLLPFLSKKTVLERRPLRDKCFDCCGLISGARQGLLNVLVEQMHLRVQPAHDHHLHGYGRSNEGEKESNANPQATPT